MTGFLFLGLCVGEIKMTKLSNREFKLADRGGDGLHPWLDKHGAFIGDGVALLTKDMFGDFAPLPQRELETVLYYPMRKIFTL